MALGIYIDSQVAITKDIRQLMEDRAFGKRLQSRIGSLGSEVTLYHMLEQADQLADALWFEGLTWSYVDLKKGERIWHGARCLDFESPQRDNEN